jgi:hypothetical protein
MDKIMLYQAMFCGVALLAIIYILYLIVQDHKKRKKDRLI